MVKHILAWKDTCCYSQSEADSNFTLPKMRRRQKKNWFQGCSHFQPQSNLCGLLAQSVGTSGSWVNEHYSCIMASSLLLYFCMSTGYSMQTLISEQKTLLSKSLAVDSFSFDEERKPLHKSTL